MSYNLTALILIGLMAELAVAGSKALGESQLALISPMIITRDLEEFSKNLTRIIETGDKNKLTDELRRFGIPFDKNYTSYEQVLAIEKYLLQRFNEKYVQHMHYMPENLSKFFEYWRLIFDPENLKILLNCAEKNIPYPLRRLYINQTGGLDQGTLYELASLRNLQELKTMFPTLIPREIVNNLGPIDTLSVTDLEVALDRAYAGYIQEHVCRLKLKDPQGAWKLVATKYEHRDVVNISRLKWEEVEEETISRYLVRKKAMLQDRHYDMLVKSKNYSFFYNNLLSTGYKEVLPRDTQLKPPQIHSYLQNSRLQEYLKPLKTGEEENFIIRSVICIQHSLETIRRQSVLAMEMLNT